MAERKTVIVVGAGAAGLMAAITAARCGAKVTLLEAMDRPGKKLLLTGNGRCNLTNLDQNLPEAYYGTGAALAKAVIKRFDAKDLIAFYREIGLLVQEKNGYVYPYCAQASAVLEVLLAEARRLKIKMKYSEKVLDIFRDDREKDEQQKGECRQQWAVKTATWCYYADALILTCGSKAVPATGSDGSGYELAKQLGHTIRTVAPALVPVVCKGDFPSQLTGVRCRAEVSLWEKSEEQRGNPGRTGAAERKDSLMLLKKEMGELQWTKYGVSGIVVFQLSRFVSLAKSGVRQFIQIDFLPETDREELRTMLVSRARMLGEEKAGMLLAGMLNEKLIPVILERAGRQIKMRKPLDRTICQNISEEQIDIIIEEIKQFTLEIAGTKSFDTAQVCAGGVDCGEIEEKTLESRLQKELYLAGELLDVDGPCGGYNLQWAWSSGYLAGKSAAGGSIN